VAFDEEGVAALVRGRVVLVTGAGGSIGSELCRQLCRFAPARLVLLDQAENPLFAIERELRELALVEPRVADVTDEPRLRRLLEELRPSALFHAAAHKHVALMEANPGEAIKNNVAGTRLLADLADELGVETFVLVSSDKAVNPTSIMGASKRLAELYVQAIAERSRTRFVAVRFGNVLASSGSVVPIFLEQIARGGPVTVTHPEATRFFMTIPEACRLVLQAAVVGRGGELCVLDMGQPVPILELARDLIRLSGLVPERDVAIHFTGLRPGEKLHEELLHPDEVPDRSRHPKVLVARGRPRARAALVEALDRLVACADGPPDALRAELRELLPEMVQADLPVAPSRA
jgi:FlaA1/EpsC-like NDP-sugar epimerase